VDDELNPRPFGNLLKIFIITSVSLAAIFLLLFYFVVRGKAYTVASEYVMSNPVVQERLGKVRKVQLSFLSFVSFRGAGGTVNYKIYVFAERSIGTVYVDLEHQHGGWKVKQANMVLPDHTLVPLQGGATDHKYY
jgi:hypothetical protein